MPRGFTLVELLVSIALILLVVTAAVTATTQMLILTRRLQALQVCDATARTTYGLLAADVAAMHPCTAVWLTSNAAGRSVEFVFMTSKRNPKDFIGRTGYTDLQWVRWHWKAKTLSYATSRSGRWTAISAGQTRNYWKIPTGSRMDPLLFGQYTQWDMNQPIFNTFLSVPQPVRETGTITDPNSPREVLNRNGWQSGEPTDCGDYEDLVRNAVPLLQHCTGLSIELVDRLGRTTTADGSADLAWAVPGSHVDARDHADLDAWPSQVRLRFTLADASDDSATVSRVYSFSCATPGLATY